MPRMRTQSPSFARRIRSSLSEELANAGVEAAVETERVPTTRLHRVMVTAKKFGQLRPSERQDLVWRIIKQHFSAEEQLLISMILTLTPDELQGK